MLEHQETTEPETSEVIRLAQQMYERDRAEQARQSSLMAAAEEVGIPSEYLTKATAQLKGRQTHLSTLVSIQARRNQKPILLALVLALATGTLMLFSLTYIRSEAPAPAVAIVQPAQPILARPMDPPLNPLSVPPSPSEVAPKTGGG